MKKLILSIIVISFILAGYAYYNIDSDNVASHWNASGSVDGHMSKFFGLFLLPLTLLGLFLLYWVIPKIDPLKKNIAKFRKYYDGLIFLICLLLFYMFGLLIVYNLGYTFNMTNLVLPGLGLFFFVMGHFMKKIKRNWFMGIRTPWTISSDEVWEKTHVLGGKIFKIIGVMILLGLFIPGEVFFPIFLTSVLGMVVFLFVYSYWLYRKL